MISDKLNKIIHKGLYNDLSHVEIIPHDKHVWFIDRDNKYWYFRYNKNTGELLWRYDFFYRFFSLFSMDSRVFTPIISSWVEDVLNHRVNTTHRILGGKYRLVEEVLNHKVEKTRRWNSPRHIEVGEVLNHKVNPTITMPFHDLNGVDEVLNHKVTNTDCCKLFTKDEISSILMVNK